MKGEDPFAEAEIRRIINDLNEKMERLFRYPAGAFDPGSTFLRDVERINRALGEGFVLMEQVLGPQQILDRIEALHPDQAPLRLPQALRDIMNLPRKMWELRPPPPDGFFRRY